MLKFKLRRVGRKRQPSYRVVVSESTTSRDGKAVEVVGFYNPRTEPETLQLKEERCLHWLRVGVQPTEAVARLLRTAGTMTRFERLKAGESMETLVVEANVAAAARPVVVKTKPLVHESKPATAAIEA